MGELARQMAAKDQEIEMLRRQQQLAADQEKNAENLLIKQNELDDLRTRFENEKDPEKKEELRKQMEAKQKEIDDLKYADIINNQNLKYQDELTTKQNELNELFK